MKTPAFITKQLKKKARIYIMPTRMGGYFNGLIFLMFLLSVGYSNNLLLIFTLFLFGLNLIWVIQTHFHLHALKFHHAKVQEQFALEKSQVEIHWKKTPKAPHKWQMSLEASDDKSFEINSSDHSESESHGTMMFNKRGVYSFGHLKVQSEMPFGLYKTWIYIPINIKVYVYPARLKDVPIVNLLDSRLEGENSSLRSGSHDIWNLAPYQGEESRKISWKHYARSGELVVKEGEELNEKRVQFRLSSSDLKKELILSKLATQMLHCSRTDVSFNLETPDKKNVTGLRECLRELSLC